jgi:N6-L-threonylcarbamoyladenine synthase
MQPQEIARRKADLCASYQAAIIDALVRKTERALTHPEGERSGVSPINPAREGGWRSLGLSGGVANNQLLQASLENLAATHARPFLRAEPWHTGDNAAMIAFAAWAEQEPGGVSEAGFGIEIAPSLPLAAG